MNCLAAVSQRTSSSAVKIPVEEKDLLPLSENDHAKSTWIISIFDF